MAVAINVVKADDGWDVVHYQGPLTEEATVCLIPLHEQAGSKVRFNFKGVEFVNSSGVRAWIQFMREFGEERTVEFEECPPDIVDQINMIPSFSLGVEVKSVYANFVAEDCNACSGKVRQKLFVRGQNMPASASDDVENMVCPDCSRELRLEDEPEEYFEFLDR